MVAAAYQRLGATGSALARCDLANLYVRDRHISYLKLAGLPSAPEAIN